MRDKTDRRLLVSLWVVAILLIATSLARGGEIGIYACPTNDTDVTHFRVYSGAAILATAPLASLTPISDQAGPSDCDGDGTPVTGERVGHVLTGVPDDCTSQAYTARWAIEVSPGVMNESADSNSISTIARPSILGINAGTGGIRQIMGNNFTPSCSVSKPDGTVIPSEFVSCQVINIQDTASRYVEVDCGLLPAEYAFPIEPPVISRF